MVHCPIDGCEYSAENKEGVRGHVMGKRDESHTGFDYNEIGEMIDSDTDDGENSGEAPEFPDADSTDTGGSEASTADCPDCGATDRRSTEQVAKEIPGEPAHNLDEYDYVCMSCGELYHE